MSTYGCVVLFLLLFLDKSGVPRNFYIEGTSISDVTMINHEWQSEVFQVPPIECSEIPTLDRNDMLMHEKCNVSKEECKKFCVKNSYKLFLWNNDETGCYIYDNEFHINSISDFVDIVESKGNIPRATQVWDNLNQII